MLSLNSCGTTESVSINNHKIEQKAKKENKFQKNSVQVVNQEVVNLAGAEAAWLPGQIQDKLKSNLQEFLGMKTVVDSKSEAALKKLQAESESDARDESTAIELGKITTAKFALFTKLRKTGSGYVISVDFTDLTTGEQMASATSKEYSKAEYLYGSTGAIDELTLALGEKLGIQISDLNKNLLASGSSNFSVDDQLALAKQNEAQFQKMMNDYDAELSKLMTSNDINAIQNKNRIEAEKALLLEKQNAEKKRQEELKAQKARADADAKLEAERSISLKTQRDQMAKDAAAKAAEVRKLKIEKQGVLGQINIIESKKKALVEIRQNVEHRSQELYDQLVQDRKNEESRIRNKNYTTVELNGYGWPTEQARMRRENQVKKSYEDLTNKFFADCEAVKQSTMPQQQSLLQEIRADQKALGNIRTVSSMGDELKVSFGTYEGSRNGWNAYLSLCSDGVLLYTDNFIVNYDALSGKKAPDMEKELDDAVIQEYANNVDMYNSLLVCGNPIVYFEIDYTVTVGVDGKDNQYEFNFNKLRVINTISGKTTQTKNLNIKRQITMKPMWDLREFAGIVEKQKAKEDSKKYLTESYMVEFGLCKVDAESKLAAEKKAKNDFLANFVKIPGKNYSVMKTEVTQKLYESIMGKNPSVFKGENNPVENVSWYDAVEFCNLLSKKIGYEPVYTINGSSVTWNENANGFRLSTVEEWQYAARGGQNYRYSGSDNLDEVGWYEDNSGVKTHPVAQKKPNGYGLYDMSGNVCEWCWDSLGGNGHYTCGGSWYDYSGSCEVGNGRWNIAYGRGDGRGFRIVRSTGK
ncbi:SUMF1/EgtB/PvdO family nonheme iron enzyme [Treponema succinifaciens]|uniref:SUMF1/EgtB/PvdO family nonheme iron enzyme n=1 Tax=Treponema succinifaciens TaxID=167 RepID=UPI0023EFDAE7|nr:SUMF1/EgtB/PvdO family nonheme iron enzyme [Treponema succinifaciens]